MAGRPASSSASESCRTPSALKGQFLSSLRGSAGLELTFWRFVAENRLERFGFGEVAQVRAHEGHPLNRRPFDASARASDAVTWSAFAARELELGNEVVLLSRERLHRTLTDQRARMRVNRLCALSAATRLKRELK